MERAIFFLASSFVDVEDPNLTKWIDNETKEARKILNKCSNKFTSYNEIDKLSTVKTESFNKQGGYYFKYFYTNQSRSASLYFKKDLKEGYHKLIDPLNISSKDVIEFSYYQVSPDGKYLAFSYSRNGSDWREIGVVDIQTETLLIESRPIQLEA